MIVHLYLNMNIYEWAWWVARLKADMKIEEKPIIWNNDTDHCGMSKREKKNEGRRPFDFVWWWHTQLCVFSAKKREHCDKRLSGTTAGWNWSWIEASVPSPTVRFTHRTVGCIFFFEQPWCIYFFFSYNQLSDCGWDFSLGIGTTLSLLGEKE